MAMDHGEQCDTKKALQAGCQVATAQKKNGKRKTFPGFADSTNWMTSTKQPVVD